MDMGLIQDDDEIDTKVSYVSIQEVHKKLKAFVKELIPNADLIRSFNGNFIYLIPVDKSFNPSLFY